MKVRTNIEYTFTTNFVTYKVGDYVKIRTKFLKKYGQITEIGFNDFEISVCGDDERLITIKYDDLEYIAYDE